jgi:hypothetical protein
MKIRPLREDRIFGRRAPKPPQRRWLGMFAKWAAVTAIWVAVVVGGIVAW